ncbi:MAG: hypothetical protein JNL58_13410 [Planctomyces sp.]|nr:hypothetical protein [Planctomyces sp.]
MSQRPATSEHTNIYACVSYRPFAYVGFVILGAFFCIFPWFVVAAPFGRLFLFACGCAALAIGLVSWHLRVALRIDECGVWYRHDLHSGQARLVAWNEIADAKCVSWVDHEGKHKALLLELVSCKAVLEENTARISYMLSSDDLNVRSNDMVLISHDELMWDPDELAMLIRRLVGKHCMRSGTVANDIAD